MKNYIVQEEYKMSYICWKCEKVTVHEVEKCLVEKEVTYLSFCPKCDKYEEFNDLSELGQKEGLQLYYLMDLERTINFDEPYFWKQNKHGYINDIIQAGKFNEIEANRIVNNDRDKMTIKIEIEVIRKILKLDE
jgi:hypothetical protein